MIAVLWVLLLAGGCRADGAGEGDPHGSGEGQRLSGSWYEVTVPSTWDVEEQEGRVEATGEPESGDRPRQVVIERNTGEPEDVRELAHAMRTLDMTQLEDYAPSDWEPVEVAGADEALRDEATWTGEDRAGASVPTRGAAVYTLTGTTGVSLYVLAHDEDYDDSWVEPIIASLRVDP